MPTPEEVVELKAMLEKAEVDLKRYREELDLARAAGFDVTTEETILRNQQAAVKRIKTAYKVFLVEPSPPEVE